MWFSDPKFGTSQSGHRYHCEAKIQGAYSHRHFLAEEYKWPWTCGDVCEGTGKITRVRIMFAAEWNGWFLKDLYCKSVLTEVRWTVPKTLRSIFFVEKMEWCEIMWNAVVMQTQHSITKTSIDRASVKTVP